MIGRGSGRNGNVRPHLALPWAVSTILALGTMLVGCPARVCDPGKSESCACANGDLGAQVCLDDGSAWADCECAGSDDDDSAVGDDDDATEGDDDDVVADDDDDSAVGDDDDDDVTAGDDDDTTEPPLSVHFGTWQYSQTGVSADSCGLFVEYGPVQDDGHMDVIDDGGGQFTLSPLRGDDASCTLTDHSFACDARMTYQENLTPMGLDAVIQIRATSTGVFASDAEMSGNHNGTASCAGSQCGEFEATLAGTFPCNVGVSFSATFP